VIVPVVPAGLAAGAGAGADGAGEEAGAAAAATGAGGAGVGADASTGGAALPLAFAPGVSGPGGTYALGVCARSQAITAMVTRSATTPPTAATSRPTFRGGWGASLYVVRAASAGSGAGGVHAIGICTGAGGAGGAGADVVEANGETTKLPAAVGT
jgi:hypothetical protein